MSTIGENILKSINILLDNKIQSLKYDKTFKTTIWDKNADGTYRINYMNQRYDIPNGLGVDLNVGQSVWVTIPSGIFRHMFISGICSQTYNLASEDNTDKIYPISEDFILSLFD